MKSSKELKQLLESKTDNQDLKKKFHNFIIDLKLGQKPIFIIPIQKMSHNQLHPFFFHIHLYTDLTFQEQKSVHF